MLWMMRGFGIVLLAACTAVAIAEPQAEAVNAPSSQAEPDPVFDILEYQVAGNSVLPALAIEQAVYPYLGEQKSIKDVESARAALEKAYHSAGYLTVFVDIPEQDIKAGTVQLKVTEGQVERLKVSGSRYYSLGRIKSSAPELAEGNVPYFPEVQKQVAELGRNQDRQVTPVLRPGRSPGKVEVELKVADAFPLHGSLELNNHYSANTTHTRLAGSLRYDNLWQREHSVSLQFQTSPENTSEVKVFSANYVWPLSGGDVLALYGVKSDSDVAAVGDVSVVGNGQIFGVRFIHPLRSKTGLSHSLNLGVDHKSFGESVKLLGADSSIDTPITYTAMTLGYDATWQSEARSTQFGAAFNFSVRGLGNNEDQFDNKRYNAKASYAYLHLNLKHTEKLPKGWSLLGKVSSQLAGSLLISNEQFSAGGADSVRGYSESEVLGDRGVLGTIELRTPDLWQGAGNTPGQLYMAGFFDAARVDVLEPLAEQKARFTLTSTGLGLRMKAKGLALDLDWGLPLKSTTNTQAREAKVHARVAYEF